MNRRKQLLLNEKVEVRQLEEGLRGSWHPGVVVGLSYLCRSVMYDELLRETGDSKLVEAIPVTKAVEGFLDFQCTVSATYRGRIRPQPSPSAASDTYRTNFTYGLCVEAFYENAWWEGVMFDRDEGAEERSVFFPDEGDELKFNVRYLRVSREWDELLGVWRDRGVWVLTELTEELDGGRPLSPFLKKLWFHLRFNNGFMKRISEWTCGIKKLWSKFLMEVLLQIAVEDCQQTVGHRNRPVVVYVNKVKQQEKSHRTDVDFHLHSPYFLRSNSNGFHIGDSTRTSGKTPYVCCRGKEPLVALQLESQGIHQAVGKEHLFSSSRGRNALTGDATLKERNQFVTKGRNSKALQEAKDNKDVQTLAIREGNLGGFPVDSSGHSAVLSEERQPLKVRQKLKKPKPRIICKTRDNEFVLDNSIQAKDMVDDSAFTGSNSVMKCIGNRFAVGHAIQSEVRESYAVPPEQKSANGNLMKKKSKTTLTERSKDKALVVDNLNRERENENTGCLMPRNVVEGHNKMATFIECFHQPEGKVSFVLPKHTRQYIKTRASMRKIEPLLIHESKDNEFGDSNPRERYDLKADASLLQESHCVFERQNWKTRYISRSNGSKSPVCSPQKRKGKGSCVIKGKGSFVGGRTGLKKFEQIDGNVESQLNEHQKAVDAPKHEVVTHCRGPLHFSGYAQKARLKDMVSRPQKRRRRFNSCYRSDTICAACHYGGVLILCDSCRSSYHLSCLGLEDVPNGDWFCPSCRCGICGLRDSGSGDQPFSSSCYQCSSQFHVDCQNNRELSIFGSPTKNFCGQKCFQIFGHLHQILGKSNPTCMKGLFWSILRSEGNDIHFVESLPKINYRCKLSHARNIMRECFHPIIDPHSKRNVVVDILFNRTSKFRRLDFHGFYIMVLQKGDEVTCVATVRIHGLMVAEMPLIATCFKYRQQGMCRLLVNEVEKMLNKLGVERLVLPAVPQLSQTWKSSFGFIEMSHEERLELLGFPLLVFQGTTMYQKFLNKSMTRKKSSGFVGILKNSGMVSGFHEDKENQVSNCERRFCGFYYKRKQKNKIIGKENMVENRNGTKDAYKYVYKRRRILASDGLSIDQ